VNPLMRLRSHKTFRVSALLLWATLAGGCQVDIAPYEDRACDDTHPCLASSGRQCVRNVCELAWDGGLAPLPDSSSTGFIAGTALTASGPLRVTQSGRVLEVLDISGCVSIEAAGVVLRNSRIRTDGVCTGALLDVTNGKGTLVEDVEIDGTGHGERFAIRGEEVILRRVHLHGSATGFRLSGNNVVLEHSVLHEFATTSAASPFVTSGGSELTIRHNVLEVAGLGDSVVTLYSQDSAIQNVEVVANLINGGGWSVTAGGGNSALPTSNVRFLRNHFGRKFHPNCGSYGPVTGFESGSPGNLWEGNVWDDTGEPVLP
jgi:hypothetical protein